MVVFLFFHFHYFFVFFESFGIFFFSPFSKTFLDFCTLLFKIFQMLRFFDFFFHFLRRTPHAPDPPPPDPPRRFKHHQNSTRRPPERERANKGAGEGKKREISGSPPSGPHLSGSHPSSPNPWGPNFFCLCPTPLGSPPFAPPLLRAPPSGPHHSGGGLRASTFSGFGPDVPHFYHVAHLFFFCAFLIVSISCHFLIFFKKFSLFLLLFFFFSKKNFLIFLFKKFFIFQVEEEEGGKPKPQTSFQFGRNATPANPTPPLLPSNRCRRQHDRSCSLSTQQYSSITATAETSRDPCLSSCSLLLTSP